MLQHLDAGTRKVRLSGVVSLACLLLVPACGLAQFERSAHFTLDTQTELIESILRIGVKKKDGSSQGTAVCIGQDEKGFCYLLTCEHVISGAVEFNFAVYSEKAYPTPTLHLRQKCRWWSEKNMDLALLKVAIPVPRSVRVCGAQPGLRMGDAVLSIGCGKNTPPCCQVAKIMGLDERSDIVYDRGGVGGRSGGLLFSNAGVVGIVARGRDDRTTAIHFKKIHAFLKACDQQWLLSD